jgi:hypothetical protein
MPRFKIASASLFSLLTLALPASVHAQEPYPEGQPGDVCSVAQVVSCADEGGVVNTTLGYCRCIDTYWVPRQIVNAEDGDVGLVPNIPNSGDGNDLVKLILGSAGQLHRHTVMFWNDGLSTRHNTMYFDPDEDGFAGGPAYVRVNYVSRKFNPDDLRNGTPGALSQTVDSTFNRGRLEATGLLLKPFCSIFTTDCSGLRDRFAAAVDGALTTPAYYRFSDYTDQVGMSSPWSTSRIGDLRGTHCSGYVVDSFANEGFTISEFFYDASLRLMIGELLHDKIHDMVMDETWLVTLVAAIVAVGPLAFGYQADIANRISNQVTNCFADLGCANTSDEWETASGTGSANSPDNLLPTSFALTGTNTYRWYHWTATTASGTGTPSSSTYSPALSCSPSGGGFQACTPVRYDNDAGVVQTPFQTVEAQIMTGGYWVTEVLW